MSNNTETGYVVFWWETDWQVLAVTPGKMTFVLSTSTGGNATNILSIVAKIFFHAKYDRQSL
ncbi:hypothetical protein [Mesorhizobium sp.]|uniref:hypothetical protein n=1 Tax=Mesorhizobium sp. TaxID=1871066 RepID=UPI000FE8022F|nr:hypothetical protein [Mesorhizobium sp.]RWK44759.1 MAG: hypothetical protein EOR47_34155 [Mesorhizobium sp.]TIP39616.1 MAG: hypothetical protein E5X62_30785 [Mesorhizobium sp.]TIQ13034.1 MAG: hypothetical protein E5X57_10460 [Mesorhizobium sp.]